MHEARWSRAKDDADKRRTRGSIFRAAISSARNERTSRLWARAAPFEHAAAPGQARAAPIEHSAAREAPVEHSALPGQARAAPVEYSAAPGQARAAISSHLRPRGRLERPFRAICGSGPSSSGHIRAICGPGAGSSGHFEPSAAPGGFERRHFEPAAAPGKARAAISRQLRLRGGLERPFRAICGSGAGFDDSCGVSSGQGEQLSHGGCKGP